MDSYQMTIDAFDKQAAAYQNRFMDVHLYDDTYDNFCRLIPQSQARIFEIGCGPGNITRYLLAQRPDFNIEATDAAPAMVELARQNNPQASVQVLDCRDLGKLPGKYDGVVCGFCLPYLSKTDCAKLIQDCSRLLNPSGVFYFSTIEGDYRQSGYETSSNGQHKAYVYYHQADYLLEMLGANNFEVLELVRKAYPQSNGATSSHLILLARKPQHPAKGSAEEACA